MIMLARNFEFFSFFRFRSVLFHKCQDVNIFPKHLAIASGFITYCAIHAWYRSERTLAETPSNWCTSCGEKENKQKRHTPLSSQGGQSEHSWSTPWALLQFPGSLPHISHTQLRVAGQATRQKKINHPGLCTVPQRTYFVKHNPIMA